MKAVQMLAAAGDYYTGELSAVAQHLDSLALPPRHGDDQLAEWLRASELSPYVATAKPSVQSLCLIRNWLAYHSPAVDAIFAVQGLCSHPLAVFADDNAWLPKLRSGGIIGAFALTEPNAGSDVAALESVAVETDDGFLLSGEKTLISNLGLAKVAVFFAKCGGQTRRDITAFCVPLDASGVEVKPLNVGGGHPIGYVSMREVRVPRAAVIGEVGRGFSIAMQTLGVFRTTVAAAAIGMADRAFDEAWRHCEGRRQFGKSLIEHESIQNDFATMHLWRESSRALTWRAAAAKDSGRSGADLDVALAKWQATENAQLVVDKALQLHGGRGVIADSITAELYRDIRPLRIYEGATEIQRRITFFNLAKQRGPS